MGNVSARKSLNISIAAIVVLTVVLTGFCVFIILMKSGSTIDIRKMRLDVNDYAQQVSDSFEKNESINQTLLNTLIKKGFSGVILDLSGNVILSFGETKEKVGDFIPLKSLQGKMQETKEYHNYEYIVPLLKDGVQTNILIFEIPDAKYRHIKTENLLWLLPVILAAAGIFVLSGYLYSQIKSTIFGPIEEIHHETLRILEGDLKTKLSYDYDDEIGSLCHDLELLRNELDVTSSRAKQLEDNKKLLLACISHDLKTPLSSISGYVEGIRDHVVKDEEGVNRYSEIILKKVHLLTKLIDDILEHTKTELDEFSINMMEVYSREYFSELYSELSLDVAKSQHELVMEEVPEFMISIDPQRMRQVVTNIITNSLKYSENGTKIEVSFFVSEQEGKKELVTSIQDHGIGISASDLPFIFDKFYRGDKARTQGIAGSGLGLNIAKYIVEKHGGRIECDSVLSLGTTIMFSLPL